MHIETHKEKKNKRIFGVSLLKNPGQYRDDYLYLCDYACYENRLFEPLPECTALVTGVNRESGLPREIDFLVVTDKSCSELAENIRENIAEYYTAESQILDCIASSNNLQNIVDIVHRFINNPLTVFDYSMKILAFTYEDNFDSSDWSESLKRKYVRLDGSEAKSLKKYLSRLEQGESPVVFELNGYKSANIAIPGQNGNIGILGVVEKNRIISDGDICFLTQLSKLLSIELQKNIFVRFNNRQLYSGLLIDHKGEAADRRV
jgi:hypothetical protein